MLYDEFLKILIQKLKYFNYSNRTIEMYSHYVEKFLIKTNKYPQHLVSNDFQNYLNNYKFTSISQQNQIINSIKFLYEKVLNKKYSKVSFQRPRKEKHLPQVIDREFLLSKISKIENLKHKAIISLGYSVGLRVSEVINLKISDIDSNRMIIIIRQAKGRKDRIVPLTQNILELLRLYYLEFKPKIYLFNGQNSEKYSSASCNQIVKKYLGEEYHFHLLRHSCFTNLTEQGIDLRVIQKLAGHTSCKTTEIYTHISKNILQKLPLAL
jgi:site-specific recombinase XerD